MFVSIERVHFSTCPLQVLSFFLPLSMLHVMDTGGRENGLVLVYVPTYLTIPHTQYREPPLNLLNVSIDLCSYWSLIFAIAGLDAQVSEMVRSGHRPSTVRTYTSVQQRYLKFCSIHQIVPLPATEINILRFIAYISSTVSYNSMQVYLSAIRALHVYNAFPPPPPYHNS